MTFSSPERINVRHLTTKQPFSSGVLLSQHGKLVMTLTTDKVSSTGNLAGTYRIASITGEQSGSESLWECAQREARKKLGTEVELLPSPHTYYHDIDSGDIHDLFCTDSIPPFLLERQSNLYPSTPRHPGLPSTPHTYSGLFLARPLHNQLQPGDNAQGLLLLPPHAWSQLAQRPTLETLLQQGAELIEREPLSRTYQLWLHPADPFSTVAPLLQKHPELLSY